MFSPLVGCICLEYNEAESREALSLGLLYWAAAHFRVLVRKNKGEQGRSCSPLPGVCDVGQCCSPLTTRAYLSARACAESRERDSASTWNNGRSASGRTSTHSSPSSILMPSIGFWRRSRYCSLKMRMTLPLY